MFEVLPFWGALLVAASLMRVIDPDHVRTRAAVLAAASLAVLVFVFDVGLVPSLLLIGTIAWVALAARIWGEAGKKRPLAASAAVIAPVIGLWVVGKLAAPMEWGDASTLQFIGFSFVLVKLWTAIKDFHDGRLPSLHPTVLAAYVLHFPTYVAGPMHLYGEFEKTLREPAPLRGIDIVDTAFRLLVGFAKVRVVVPLLRPMSLEALTTAETIAPRSLLFGSAVYSVLLWSEFSGYSDLAIGTSRLLGVKTPENFANPYGAPNIREFWQRWHITFSRVLTSYVFVPLTRALPGLVGNRQRLAMIIGYVVTFLFCGFWHGATPNFLLWGLYHALGLIAFDLTRPWLTRRRLARKKSGPPPPAGLPALLARTAAVVGTFAFVTVGWIFFVLPMSVLGRALPW